MRNLTPSLLVAAISMAPAAARADGFTAPTYVVTADGGGLGVTIREAIIISVVMNAPQQAEARGVWVAERRRQNKNLRNTLIDHHWTESRACPSLTAALAAVDGIPAMKFGSPSTAFQTGWVSDTPLTSLRGPPTLTDGSGVTLTRSEFKGPVAEWRKNLNTALADCWQAHPPVLPGVTVTVRLGSDQDANQYIR